MSCSSILLRGRKLHDTTNSTLLPPASAACKKERKHAQVLNKKRRYESDEGTPPSKKTTSSPASTQETKEQLVAKLNDNGTITVTLPEEQKSVLDGVGIDDPAALIMWEPTNLTNALTDINGAGVAFPVWLNGGVNPIPDIATLMQNILTHVATMARGGGVVGNCLIAPNTIPQYANIKTQLSFLGILPIFRAISPAHLPIGSNYIIADRTRNTTATADPVQAPPAALGSGIIL